MSYVNEARERLDRHGSETAVLLAEALRRFAARELEPEEQRGLRAIAKLAARLKAREDIIDTSHSGTGRRRSVGDVAKASKGFYDGSMMFLLARAFRPRLCLELGTNVGISGAYQASAQRLNGGGRLVTLEGQPARAAIAESTFAELGLEDVEIRVGHFEQTLDPALTELDGLDWSFIDGHHFEEPTVDYYTRIAARIGRPGVILVDDIVWSEGMMRAWARIAPMPGISFAVELGRIGLCLLEP
jgi:predicted O-methyltransferase YrrM